MVRIGVLGATGGVGRLFCKSALALGHDVSVLVRSKDKVTKVFGDDAKHLNVVLGDSTNKEDVAKLAQDARVLICLVGTPPRMGPDDVIMAKTASALLKATKSGQKIFFCSSLGMGGSQPFIRCMLRLIAGKWNVDDCDLADAMLMDSIGKGGGTITVIRPNNMDDGTTGKYTALKEGKISFKPISRAGVSQFLLDHLNDTTWEDKAVCLY